MPALPALTPAPPPLKTGTRQRDGDVTPRTKNGVQGRSGFPPMLPHLPEAGEGDDA